MTKSEYVIVPWNYEELLDEEHTADLTACQLAYSRELCSVQEQHAKEREKLVLELTAARQQACELKRTNTMWRTKAVIYKMNLVSACESAQLTLAQLRTSETLSAGLTQERDNLLRSNKALQEQVQCLTALCQGQHRAKVQQQSELASTSAEAKQLHDELLQLHELSDVLAQQLADERAAHGVARDQSQSLRLEIDEKHGQLQAHISSCAGLRAEVAQLQEALSQEQAMRVSADTRAEKLSHELVLREAELKAALQSSACQVQATTERIEQIRAVHGKVIEQLQQSVDQLNDGTSRERQRAVEDRQRLEAQLQQERSMRDALERECGQQRQRLLQERSQVCEREGELQRLRDKIAAMDTLRRQVSERDAEVERLQEKLTAMERLRRQFDEKDMEMQRLQDKLAAMDVLRRQISDKEVELEVLQGKLLAMEKLRRQASDKQVELELLQDKLAAVEKTAARVAELEAALERSTQQLGQQASNKDAAVKALREQLEQQRKALEHKEELLRDTETAHARQLELFQRRLADNEAAAREQEVQLRQHLDKAAQAGSAEAQAQQRLAELQASLASRDERIRQLQGELSAEASRSEARMEQVRTEHGVQVADLEARIRHLQHQMAVLPSPVEPQRQQVRSANAAVDKLMGNLLGNTSGLLAGALGALDDEDEEGGLSADLILNMSQLQVPPGDKVARTAFAAAAPAGALAVHEAVGGPAVETQDTLPAAAADCVGTGRASGSKRAPGEPANVEERPAGKGRGRKAAKGANTAAVAQASSQEAKADGEKLPEPPPEEAPRGGRNADRRRAAQTGQARAKALAAVLGADTGSDSEDPEEEAQEAKPVARTSQRRGKAAVVAAAAAAAQPAGPYTAAADAPLTVQTVEEAGAAMGPPPPKRRGRPARVGKGKAAEPTAVHGDEELPGLSHQAPVQAAAEELQQPGNRKDGKAVLAADAAQDTGAAHEQGADATVSDDIPASQPPTQPQPHAQPCDPVSRQPHRPDLISSVGLAVVKRDGAQQQVPSTSQFSMFSQGFKPYEANLTRNPLATINQRVIEQAKSRVRLVPLAALQQLKPMSKVLPPSIAKAQAGTLQGATKRPLPQAETQQGTVIPSDLLLRTLQQPPSKVGKTGK